MPNEDWNEIMRLIHGWSKETITKALVAGQINPSALPEYMQLLKDPKVVASLLWDASQRTDDTNPMHAFGHGRGD
jgi:hypothetical protein